MVSRHEANRFISQILMLHTAQAVVQPNLRRGPALEIPWGSFASHVFEAQVILRFFERDLIFASSDRDIS